jgi:Xaa-Pro aminopeptidase
MNPEHERRVGDMPAGAALDTGNIPFACKKLDRLLDEAGIDVMLATSKHNVRYLLGGHWHHFFGYMDAIGVSRYLPIVIYEKGHLEHGAYVANRNEKNAIATRVKEAGAFWTPTVIPGSSGTLDAMALAIEHLNKIGAAGKRLGVEAAFLPMDAARMLADAFFGCAIVDGLRPLERLRAIKSAHELALLRQASDLVVGAMLEVITRHAPGTAKRTLVEALRREETNRGLTFEYALVTVGASHNRAPSGEIWQENDVISLDSGGNYQGYIGDLCRMGILGTPDAELQDLLGEVDRVQQAARRAVRGGARGGDVYAAAEAALATSAHSKEMHFVAHGMGMVSHEAPRLTGTGPIPYPADDAELPLEAGMVLSIETTLPHARRGFIKLEDTVAVTERGPEGFGDRGRGWNLGGSAA